MRPSQLKDTLTIVAIAGFGIVGLAFGWSWYTESRPGVPTPSATPRQLFDSQVTAVLDRRCSNCHGLSVEAYQKLESDPKSRVLLRWPLDERTEIPAASVPLGGWIGPWSSGSMTVIVTRRLQAATSSEPCTVAAA